MASNYQPRPTDRAVAQNAQRAQTPIVQRNAPAWMANYQTPSSVGDDYGDPIMKVSQLIGHVLKLTAVESGRSASKGRFTRWTYTELDPETGEVTTPEAKLLAFAQPVVRMADNLAGSQLDGYLAINPPLVVRVDTAGDVVLFVDP